MNAFPPTAFFRVVARGVASSSTVPSVLPVSVKLSLTKNHHSNMTATHRSFSTNSQVPVTTDTNERALIPINFDVASKISGEESQIVEISLSPNQTLRAESGAMIYMTQNVQMETTTGEGGLSSGFKRMLTGQNLMVSDFTYHGGKGTTGTVALGTDFPSKILRLNLNQYGNKIICQKGAYLAGSHTVEIEMEFAKKFTTGFFGGEGFVLQSLNGDGDVFVKAGGTLIRKDLQEGETLRVSSGSLVAFTQSVDFDVTTMPGFKNVLFGGEGLFITTLTGPGTVWLQGMPPDRMISEIVRRIPSGGGIGLGIPLGMGGGGGTADADGGGEGTGDDSAEDMVAATDAAVDADRQATVASSGLGGIGDSSSPMTEDPDAPSSLFGDAAPPPPVEETSTSSSDDWNDFDDSTTFSSNDVKDVNFGDDVTEQQFDDFAQEDTTTFSSYDEEQEDIFDAGSDDSGVGGGEEGGGVGDVLKSIWDFFSDDD
mmetsp:Transcript_15181/g.22172  ORF Transcript_15181/g.22172 Transcript_15181/m.22172 type:complete len:484 (+) Transcript_15181:87-1538(+)